MKSSILTQLAIPPILKNAPVSVGDTDLARLSVTTEDTPPPANTSLVMVTNTSEASMEVVTDAQVDQKVRELIYKFGSHICPDAVLGGYWRIDAKYSSLETKDRVEVDNIVTRAIQAAETDSRAFNAAAGVAGISTKGAGAAGAAAEGGESESSSSSSDETQGDAEESEQASKTTKLEIEQSWKGGAPGTQPADWRRSLDEAFSSNWKIIDHVFPKCVGIWRFVKDADTQRKLCETWLEIYLEEGPTAHVTKRIEESARKKACESTLYMNAIRQEAQELVRLDSEASTRLSRELCESNQAYPHFRFTPTRLRSPNATMAAVQGIRLGLDQESVTVFEFQPQPADGIGWEIPLGTSINVRFASTQSVTDFSFLLTPDKYGQDPIEFKLEATQDKTNGPWRTLLKFTLDERAQVLSDAPAAGESTTFREAWSRWIPVRGAAEGYFWDNTDQTCKEKQCLCTAEDGTNQPGTKGRFCLSDHGSLNCPSCCTDEQRATCSTFDCTAAGPTSGTRADRTSAKCVSGLCTAAADAATCCDDVTLARDFNLVIKTKDENNCGTGRDVHATLDGVTADGSEVSNSQQRMATKKYDDFKRGDRQTYAYRSSERMRPSQICLKLDIGGASPRWCVEYVRVLNGDVSGSPQIGEDVTGWVDFDQVNDKQCLNLQFQ